MTQTLPTIDEPDEPMSWRERDDARVYLTLERARRRCNGLRRAPDSPLHGSDRLEAVNRMLGMAAFLACEHLDSDQRRRLRDEAGRLDASSSPPVALLEDLTSLLSTAGHLSRTTQDPAICEELHLAALHIDEALEHLGVARVDRRPAWSRW